MKPKYKELEDKYAKFVGSKYAVSCNSGTSALHLAFMAIKLQPGDEVIMSDFVMGACAFAVSYTGAKPVFVDCDERFNINVKQIESRITGKTKAILAVHIYGRICNMKEIMRIAKKHKLYVIEDACEAQGAIYRSKADLTVYSFFKNKIISAEEGGIITTNNSKFAERMNFLKNMAFDKDHTYYHEEIGYNYRMPESQAILALQSLKKYKINANYRRKIVKEYDKFFSKLRIPGTKAHWVYDIVFPDPDLRDLWYSKLKEAGIAVRLFFKPMTDLPMYEEKIDYSDCPIRWKTSMRWSRAVLVSRTGLYLPINNDMTKAKVAKIAKIIYGHKGNN